MAYVDLSVAKRRLAWADGHIKRFEAKALDFLQSDPYLIVADIEPKTGDEVFRVKFIKPFPDCLGLITADALHNLRSILDHLAYAVALLPTSQPVNLKNVSFPICLEASGSQAPPGGFFSQYEGGPLLGVVQGGIEVIRGLQPYQRPKPTGAPRETDILWMLNRLWNDDKHKTVNVIGACSRRSRARMKNVTVDLSKGNVPSPFTFGPMKDGKEVARIPAHVKVEGDLEMKFIFDITFDQAPPGYGAQVNTFLRHTHDFIRDEVIPVFGQNFS